MTDNRAILKPLRALAREALARLPGDVGLGRTLGHGENTIFACENAPWVVRVHRRDYHSEEGIAAELAFMRFLDAQGFCVPVPMGDIQRCEDRIVTVLRRVEGRMRTQISARRAVALGATIAALHEATRAWSGKFARPVWDFEGLVGSTAVWGALEEGGIAPDLADAFRDRAREILGDLGPVQPVHHDLHSGNVVWQGTRVGLIDFDDCGWGHPLFDLAIPFGRLSEARQADVIRGYGGLSDADLAKLPTVRLVLWARILPWLASRSDVPELAEMLPDVRTRLTARIREWMN